MKKLLVLTIIMALPLIFNSAYAYPVSFGNYNGLFFNNAEVLLDKDASGTVSIGDTFWGTVELQNIKAPTNASGQGGLNIWALGGGLNPPTEITGYFATDVIGVAPGPGSNFTIILGPAVADPNGKLAAGEVLRVYEDTNVDYNDSTQATALATATDGTLHSSLGLAGGYWYTFAPIVPPGAGDIGESFAGLNYVISPFGVNKVNDPNEGLFNLNVDLYFNSELGSLGNFGGPNSGTLMHFFSNDPGVQFPVPEPSSMLLFGMGMLGLANRVARRKKVA